MESKSDVIIFSHVIIMVRDDILAPFKLLNSLSLLDGKTIQEHVRQLHGIDMCRQLNYLERTTAVVLDGCLKGRATGPAYIFVRIQDGK
jgi:hypothetical protein